MGGPPSETAARKTPRQTRSTRLILAAFICAVGFTFLVISVSALKPNWFGPPLAPTSPFVILILFALSICIWFYAENRRPQPRLNGTATTIRAVKAVLYLEAGALAAIGAFGLYLMRHQSISTPIYDQYALAFGDEASPNDPVKTVLFWWAKRDQDGAPAGALPMFLGSLLAVGFGVWFPKIALAASEGSLGAVEKFVAPLLSLALVGIGASQQSDQNRADMDRNLTIQGLPASLRLTAQQKVDQKFYAMDGGRMSDASIALLQQRVADLQAAIDHPVKPEALDPKIAAELTSLESQLQKVQTQIYSIKDRAVTVNPPDLGAITKGLEAIQKAESDAVDVYRTEGAGACALMAVEYNKLIPHTQLVLKSAASDLRVEAKRNPLQKAAAWATGMPKPDDGTQLDGVAANLEQTQMTLQQTIQRACPQDATMASVAAAAANASSLAR